MADNKLIITSEDNQNLLTKFMKNALQSELAPALNELWVVQIDPLTPTGITLIEEFSTMDDVAQRDPSYLEAIRRGSELIKKAGTDGSCMFVSAVNIPGMGLQADRDMSMSSLGVVGGMISKGRNYPSLMSIIVNDGVFSMVDGFFRPWMLAVSAKSLKTKELKTTMRCIYFERNGDEFKERKRFTFTGTSPVDIKGFETTYSASSTPKQLNIDFMFDKMITDVLYTPYKDHNAGEKRIKGSVVHPDIPPFEMSVEDGTFSGDKVFQSMYEYKDVSPKKMDINGNEDGFGMNDYNAVITKKLPYDIRSTGKIIKIHGTNLSNIIDPFDIVRVSKYVKILNIVNFLKAPGVTYLIKMLIDKGFSRIVEKYRLPDTRNYADPELTPKTVAPITNRVLGVPEEILNVNSKALSINQDDSNPVSTSRAVLINENDSNPYGIFKRVGIDGNDSDANSKYREVTPNPLDTAIKIKNVLKDIKKDETYVKPVKVSSNDMLLESPKTERISVKRTDTPLF